MSSKKIYLFYILSIFSCLNEASDNSPKKITRTNTELTGGFPFPFEEEDDAEIVRAKRRELQARAKKHYAEFEQLINRYILELHVLRAKATSSKSPIEMSSGNNSSVSPLEPTPAPIKSTDGSPYLSTPLSFNRPNSLDGAVKPNKKLTTPLPSRSPTGIFDSPEPEPNA